MESERSGKKARTASAKDILDTLQEEMGNSDSRMYDLAIQLKDAMERENREMVQRHLQENRKQQEEHAKVLSEHKKEIDEHKKEIDEHKKEIDEHKKEIDEHKKEIDEHKKEIDEHKKEIDEHKKEIDEHKKEIDEHKKEIDEHKKENTGNKEKIAKNDAEMRRLREIQCMMAEDLLAHRVKLNETSAKLETTQAGLQTTRADLQTTQTELEKLKQTSEYPVVLREIFAKSKIIVKRGFEKHPGESKCETMKSRNLESQWDEVKMHPEDFVPYAVCVVGNTFGKNVSANVVHTPRKNKMGHCWAITKT